MRFRESARRALPWLIAAAVAFPLAALLHEVGHLTAAWASGISGAQLHYGSVTFPNHDEFWRLVESGNVASAARLHPPASAAVAVAGGLIVSYFLVALCAWMSWRHRVQPLIVAVGLMSNTRFVLLPLTVVVSIVAGRPVGGTDEAKLAMASGIPLIALAARGKRGRAHGAA